MNFYSKLYAVENVAISQVFLKTLDSESPIMTDILNFSDDSGSRFRESMIDSVKC